MSGVFMDGGSGDSISHGGDGVDYGGGSDQGQASYGIEHGHGQAGHNFLAQILGLDQQDHAHLAHHGGEGAEGLAPSQSPSWNSALQGLKLENLLAGINITPNFLLFALFASFVGWLGVIYWIRHHEPFANQVLGTPAAFAPTVGADRQLINRSCEALPIRTSAQSGIVYLPEPGQNNSDPAPGSKVNAGLSAAMSAALGQSGSSVVPVQSYGTTQSYAATQPSARQSYSGATQGCSGTPRASSPVNQGLSAAMASALGSAGAPGNPVGSVGPSYVGPESAGPPNCAVNQNLSAAMASALGPASAAGEPTGGAGSPQAGATYPGQAPASPANGAGPAYPSNFSSGPSAYPTAPSMMAQTMPGAASAPVAAVGPMAREGSMRLYSSRRARVLQGFGATPDANQGQALSQAQALSQSQAPQSSQPALSPMPAPPAKLENPNTWSLANQGMGTFSADTARFNSQFGAPLDAANGAAYPPADSQSGPRQKIVTDK